jgi:site-specific recombinase XerC
LANRLQPEITLQAHLDDWLDSRAADDAAEHVVNGYRAALKLHVYPTLGTTALSELRRSDVGDLVTGLHKAGKARNTIRNVLSPLCKGLNDAVDRELLTANPAAGIKMPKKAKRRAARVPSPAELQKIIEKAAPADDDAPPDAPEIVTAGDASQVVAERGDMDVPQPHRRAHRAVQLVTARMASRAQSSRR